MVVKLKEIIIGIIASCSIAFTAVYCISTYRSIDKNYSCSGYVDNTPKIYSLHYKRFFSGLFWSDWGWSEVKLESGWYDFAGFYYFDEDGELDNKIMSVDKSVYFFKDRNTIHASTGLDTPQMRKLVFNLTTGVLIFENREKKSVFQGICKEVK